MTPAWFEITSCTSRTGRASICSSEIVYALSARSTSISGASPMTTTSFSDPSTASSISMSSWVVSPFWTLMPVNSLVP